MNNKELAFLAGRVAFGVNFLAHGLVRLPKLDAFASWMQGEFVNTMLPNGIIYPFAIVLTIAEFILGLTLILGWKTKASLLLTMGILTALMFGSSMQENWKTVGVQMVYVAFNYLMLLHYSSTRYSIDYLTQTRQR